MASPVKTWCPSLHEPMAAADGLLVRVKPAQGRLLAGQARLVAEAACLLGNGLIDVTSRANLQIRGLDEDGAGRFAEGMVRAGLASADAAVERRRSIVTCPLAGPATLSLAAALEEALVAATDLAALPAKFGFLVEGGALPAMRAVTADITLRLDGPHCRIGLGAGDQDAARVPLAQAVPAAIALARAFIALAAGHAPPPRRMARLVERMAPGAVLAAAGLVAGDLPAASASSVPPLGWLAPASLFAAPAFGRLAGTELAALAAIADRYGDGLLRPTPWRSLAIAGIAAQARTAAMAEVAALGMMTDRGDPRHRVLACVGRGACPAASVDSRGDALALLERLNGRFPAGTLHVSGCAKACASRRPAAVTLVGRDGRYDVVLDGGADDLPIRRGLGLDEVAAFLATVPALRNE